MPIKLANLATLTPWAQFDLRVLCVFCFLLLGRCWKFWNSQVEIDANATRNLDEQHKTHTHSFTTYTPVLNTWGGAWTRFLETLCVGGRHPQPLDHLRHRGTRRTKEVMKIRLKLQKLWLRQPAKKESLQTETCSRWNRLTKSDSSVWESHHPLKFW